jgi:hypothetical protein
VEFDEWDLRQATLTGQFDKMYRWFCKNRDLAHKKIYEAQVQGNNVTRWVFIVNLKRLNTQIHLCSNCKEYFFEISCTKTSYLKDFVSSVGLRFYADVVTSHESVYPDSLDRLYIVNGDLNFNFLFDRNIRIRLKKLILIFLAPSIFEVILNIVRPLLSAETARTIQVYGPSSGWESKVFATIDRDQLRSAYSGTKEN